MANDEALGSGYGVGTAPGDNLCNDFQQETARSFGALAHARGDRYERRDGVTLTDSRLPLPFWNRAVLDEPLHDADSMVAVLRDFYEGGPPDAPYLLDSAWPTPDLRTHGFTLMGHPPLMVRPARLPLPASPPELRIEPVIDATRARDLTRTLIDGYPAPQLRGSEDRFFTPDIFDADGWKHFVGYVGNEAVGAGSAYSGDTMVRVENIAVLPAARGRGYGLALTAATIDVAPEKPAVLVASDLGRPTYERLGFVAIFRVTYWLGFR